MHIISVFALGVVKPNPLHAFTIIAMIFLKLSVVYEAIPAKFAYIISYEVCTSLYFCQATVHSFTADPFSRIWGSALYFVGYRCYS